MRCLNNILEDFFYHYSKVVIKYVYLFLLIPVILTALLSSGLYFIEINFVNDTQYLFTPINGPYNYELATFSEHFPLDQTDFVPGQHFDVKHYVYLVVTGKGNGNENLLKNELLDEIEKLNKYILDEINVNSYDGLYHITYREICMTYELACFENPHVPLLRHIQELEEYNNHIRYPVIRIPLDKPFYVGSLLGNVEVNDTEGRIKSVGAIRLTYYFKQNPLPVNYYSIQFRDNLQNYLLNTYRSDLIDVAFLTDDSLIDGLTENTRKYLPEIGVTVALVFLFSLLCSFSLYRIKALTGPRIDWVRSKPLLAMVGIMEPALAIMSTIGFLLFCTCPFNDIIVVMPFIVFGNFSVVTHTIQRRLSYSNVKVDFVNDSSIVQKMADTTYRLSFALYDNDRSIANKANCRVGLGQTSLACLILKSGKPDTSATYNAKKRRVPAGFDVARMKQLVGCSQRLRVYEANWHTTLINFLGKSKRFEN